MNKISINEVQDVFKFAEKPNCGFAKKYFESGNYVWNRRMFIFKYATMINEIKKYIIKHYKAKCKIENNMGSYEGYELMNSAKNILMNFHVSR